MQRGRSPRGELPGFYWPAALGDGSAKSLDSFGSEATWITYLLGYCEENNLAGTIDWGRGFGFSDLEPNHLNRTVTTAALPQAEQIRAVECGIEGEFVATMAPSSAEIAGAKRVYSICYFRECAMQTAMLLLLLMPAADPAFQPPQTDAEVRGFFVGNWMLEANEDDLKVSIDYLTWRAKGVDDQGQPIPPTQEEIQAAHDRDLERRVKERADGAKRSHLYFTPDGRLLQFRRYTAKSKKADEQREAQYSTELIDGKVFLTIQNGDQKSRGEVTLVDAKRYRTVQMGTKIKLPTFSFTYLRMDNAPAWCEQELADKLSKE